MRYCVSPENDHCQNAATVTCIWNFLLVQYLLSTIQNCFAQSENIAPFTVAICSKRSSCNKQYRLSFFKVTKVHNILNLPPEKQGSLQSLSIQDRGVYDWRESQAGSVTGLTCLYNHCTIKSKHIWQGWTIFSLYSKKYIIITSETACLTSTCPNK